MDAPAFVVSLKSEISTPLTASEKITEKSTVMAFVGLPLVRAIKLTTGTDLSTV